MLALSASAPSLALLAEREKASDFGCRAANGQGRVGRPRGPRWLGGFSFRPRSGGKKRRRHEEGKARADELLPKQSIRRRPRWSRVLTHRGGAVICAPYVIAIDGDGDRLVRCT